MKDEAYPGKRVMWQWRPGGFRWSYSHHSLYYCFRRRIEPLRLLSSLRLLKKSRRKNGDGAVLRKIHPSSWVVLRHWSDGWRWFPPRDPTAIHRWCRKPLRTFGPVVGTHSILKPHHLWRRFNRISLLILFSLDKVGCIQYSKIMEQYSNSLRRN